MMSPFAPLISLMPANALKMPMPEVLLLLERQFGEHLYHAFEVGHTTPSPLREHKTTAWMKTAHTVGINVRTIGSFWDIIPYALTLPTAQNAIHILPVWEPGVVASLYGPASWNINPEFFNSELSRYFPALDTVEKQLKAVVNVLHLLGKAVGMDVVPHTDRYSEQVLANPALFEWLQRRNMEIVRHEDNLYRSVQEHIFEWLQYRGSALDGYTLPTSASEYFEKTTESTRIATLFGKVADYSGRLARRKELVDLLYQLGYETAPATMGPPYRGLEVDPNPEAAVRDEDGRLWRDYRITRPEKFSRAFGPLTRFKLYGSKDNNRQWELDFSAPNDAAWTYVTEHYFQIQEYYNFDFMRGDMSHVQMRPDGVPAERDAFYDILGAVKQRVLASKPWFGYFAESFLAPPGEMAFGDECDHLEASFADSTLGDLQSEPVETDLFMQLFAKYRFWLENRQFAPNFTIMTADKDDPRFDSFYLTGNEIRYFIGLFLTDMPSYMALGFESREVHLVPAPNEHYTKLYVFQEKTGPKCTNGPYQWGTNATLYQQLVRQKLFSNQIWATIADKPVRWILAPDPTGENKIIAWTQPEEEQYVFIANLDTQNGCDAVPLPGLMPHNWNVIFSTTQVDLQGRSVTLENEVLILDKVLPGEGVVLRG